MILSWYHKVWDEYLEWQKEEKKILKKNNSLIEDDLRNPTEGIGKPEPLKHELTGAWSWRINQEHRLVYVSLRLLG